MTTFIQRGLEMKNSLFILFIFLSQLSYPQSDSIYVTIEQDTITIWHTNSTRNCCSLFELELNIMDSLIVMTEVDTGEYCFCECHFDFHIAFTGLNPGSYVVDVFGTDSIYPLYWGSTSFTYETFGIINQDNSGCLGSRDDTSFIEISTNNNNMALFWNTPRMNCCLEEFWDGWLSADTFHVSLSDTGPPCDCICPFELSATFGPFTPGNYILDFQDGEFGYPGFTIGGRNTFDDITILHQEQSDCYSVAIHSNNNTPDQFKLHSPYPNPFNPSGSIVYDIQNTAPVSITIYNLLGGMVIELVDEVKTPGTYQIAWDGRNALGQSMASGIYFVNMATQKYRSTQKVLLLR